MSARDALIALQRSGRPRILFVWHGEGGGIRRHVEELASALEGHAEVVFLEPFEAGTFRLRTATHGAEFAIALESATEWPVLVRLLQAIGVDRIHYHHVHGLPAEVLDLPVLLDCPYDLTLHDLFPACSAYHLTDGSGRFCGAAPDCQRCIEMRPSQWAGGVDDWRLRFGTFLQEAARVIAPSHATATLLHGFFPAVEVIVWPHAEHAASSSADAIRVLVPGAISEAKGLGLLQSCIEDAAIRGLPLHFRIVGFLGKAIRGASKRHWSMTGEFTEGDLSRLLALERGDVAFFPAQCPETFSYALSDVMEAGLPIVTTDLGALPERAAGRPNAHVVRWDASAAEVNDALLRAAAQSAVTARPAVDRVTFDDYRTRYLAHLRRRRRLEPPLPELEDRWLQPRTPPEKQWSYRALFEDAVECGRATSLHELCRRMEIADRTHDWAAHARPRLETLEDERAGLTGQLTSLMSRLQAREERVAEQARQLSETRARLSMADSRLQVMENSRSWRLTAPLRALVARLRRIAR